MDFENTLHTGIAVIKALKSASLGPPTQKCYVANTPSGSSRYVRGGGSYGSGTTTYCLAAVVANEADISLPSLAHNNLTLDAPELKYFRKELRSEGISANRLADAQKA